MRQQLRTAARIIATDLALRAGVWTRVASAAQSSHVNSLPPRRTQSSGGRAIGTKIFGSRETEMPAYGVQVFKGGQIVGDRGRAKDARGRWIIDYGLPLPGASRGKPQHLSGITVNLCGPVSKGNYYHFLINSLPQLKLLQLAGIVPDHIFLHADEEFEREFISLLGINGKIVAAHENSRYICDTLVVPDRLPRTERYDAQDFTCLDSVFQPDWVGEYLDSAVRAANPELFAAPRFAGLPKRFYISRGKARNRWILNEDALLAALSRYGVERIYLEDFNIVDQVALFHQAEFICGPHGAGFSNLVFCRPGTRVVEILATQCPLSYFRLMAETRGLRYCYQAVDGIFNGDPKKHPAYDCNADIEQLCAFLDHELGRSKH